MESFTESSKLTARLTRKCADSTFSLADLARENLHALNKTRQTGYLLLRIDFSSMLINGTGKLIKILKIYREAIGSFGRAGRSTKGPRLSAAN